ncbi:MAG: haloacid dehalogenase-like hydrolase [bacterium]
MKIHIGVDFDNTIVCYDSVFHQLARKERLIPHDVETSKEKIRNYLRQIGKEDAWTKMQGYGYGPGIKHAEPFPGVVTFFRFCRKESLSISIVSHKTRHPYLGPPYNLHKAAYGWLQHYGFFDQGDLGLTRDQVFFELTMEEKINRIKQLGCTHFIDDLPEFLSNPHFPPNITTILFDPKGNYVNSQPLQSVSSWENILHIFRKHLDTHERVTQKM